MRTYQYKDCLYLCLFVTICVYLCLFVAICRYLCLFVGYDINEITVKCECYKKPMAQMLVNYQREGAICSPT